VTPARQIDGGRPRYRACAMSITTDGTIGVD
jgi:hypothetical protein